MQWFPTFLFQVAHSVLFKCGSQKLTLRIYSFKFTNLFIKSLEDCNTPIKEFEFEINILQFQVPPAKDLYRLLGNTVKSKYILFSINKKLFPVKNQCHSNVLLVHSAHSHKASSPSTNMVIIKLDIVNSECSKCKPIQNWKIFGTFGDNKTNVLSSSWKHVDWLVRNPLFKLK